MSFPHVQGDRTSELDGLMLDFRRADDECISWHVDFMPRESARYCGRVNDLEDRIRELRTEMGLPVISNLRTWITEAEPCNDSDRYGKIVVKVCDRNYLMSEIGRGIEDLAKFMFENVPDRERIAKSYWALADAKKALSDALKPNANV